MILVTWFILVTTSKAQVVSSSVIPQLPDSLKIGVTDLRVGGFMLLELWLGGSIVPVFGFVPF
jgi:hypothetical protein